MMLAYARAFKEPIMIINTIIKLVVFPLIIIGLLAPFIAMLVGFAQLIVRLFT